MHARTLALAALVLAACTPGGPRDAASARPRFDVRADPEDEGVAAGLQPVLAAGTATCVAFFGTDFPEPFTVFVCRDRASFEGSFPAAWGLGETSCWMVGVGVADGLYLLSPRVWSEEACEHDPTDAQHVRDLVTHELVHVFHGQHNPTRDFTGADDVGWFAEGLAVYVSGQLDHGHLADPREAVALGLAPTRLQDAWSGRYRYGVCGSLVHYVDRTCGRAALVRMLGAVHQEELLEEIGLSEDELLAGWRQSVLAERR